MVDVIEIANGHGVEFLCAGQVDIQQLCASKQNFAGRFPRAGGWYFAIVDFSETSDLRAPIDDIPMLVDCDHELSHVTRPGLLIAIVAPEALAYDTSRIWQAVSQSTGWESKVFRSREAAESWVRQRVSSAFRVELPGNLAA